MTLDELHRKYWNASLKTSRQAIQSRKNLTRRAALSNLASEINKVSVALSYAKQQGDPQTALTWLESANVELHAQQRYEANPTRWNHRRLAVYRLLRKDIKTL